jgi:UDP-glucose 4-epimerase
MTLNAGRPGWSVREVIGAFERACGRASRDARAAAARRRRPGAGRGHDSGAAGARSSRDADLDAICADAWRWQKNGGRY